MLASGGKRIASTAHLVTSNPRCKILAHTIAHAPDWGNDPGRKSFLRDGGRMDYFAALRAFVRAVDLGSFSKAAVEQGVKVSTISRYVTALETDLAAALLNRSTRRLHLTEVGTAFYERATQILSEVDDARSTARSFNQRPQGLLRLNTPGAFWPTSYCPPPYCFPSGIS
jgi:hypothetical protein